MRIPMFLLGAASALSLTGCATYAPTAPYGSATVTVATKAPYGTYLTDGSGRALYILEGQRLPNGTVPCDGPCLAVWPPVHGAAVAGPGIDPALLTTAPMHGAPHAIYAGWPLYYYSHDAAPGDTTGQNVHDTWGTWHLLSPSGATIAPGGSGY